MNLDECRDCTWYQHGKEKDPFGEMIEWDFCEYHQDLIEYIYTCTKTRNTGMFQRGYGEMHKEIIKGVMAEVLLLLMDEYLSFIEIKKSLPDEEVGNIQEALEILRRKGLLEYNGVMYNLPCDVYSEIKRIKWCAVMESKLLRCGMEYEGEENG